jgi:hypothetical protein
MPDSRLAPPLYASPATARAPTSIAPRVNLPAVAPMADAPRAEPRLGPALVAGAAAATIGAAVWATVTVLTEFQIGWMAVGVGAGVGLATRRWGRGVAPKFGVAAAALALLGCLAGNLFASVGFVARFAHVSFFAVLASLDPGVVRTLMGATFSPMDLLFYGIAMAEAYKLAFLRPAAPVGASSPDALRGG